MNNNPCRKPDGPYLIEAAPHHRQYLASKTAREIVQRMRAVTPVNKSRDAKTKVVQTVRCTVCAKEHPAPVGYES